MTPEQRRRLSLLSPGAAQKATDEGSRDATITITLCALTPGRIGPVLDELMAMLAQMAKKLEGTPVRATVELPDHHQTFYGWESDRDDPPS